MSAAPLEYEMYDAHLHRLNVSRRLSVQLRKKKLMKNVFMTCIRLIYSNYSPRSEVIRRQVVLGNLMKVLIEYKMSHYSPKIGNVTR